MPILLPGNVGCRLHKVTKNQQQSVFDDDAGSASNPVLMSNIHFFRVRLAVFFQFEWIYT